MLFAHLWPEYFQRLPLWTLPVMLVVFWLLLQPAVRKAERLRKQKLLEASRNRRVLQDKLLDR